MGYNEERGSCLALKGDVGWDADGNSVNWRVASAEWSRRENPGATAKGADAEGGEESKLVPQTLFFGEI